MLKTLTINNIAVIEQTTIDFEKGFSTLTGETGSGKSIIIDSLGAVLGSRTSKDLVRTGAESARVIAEFVNIGDSVIEKLREHDLYDDEDSLIIQRNITADGKSSCRINGKPVTAAVTKEIASLLVNIHGQRDSGDLLKVDNHIRYIDKLVANEQLFSEYKVAYRELCDTIRALRELNSDEAQKQALVKKLNFEIEEISSANLTVGEQDKLLARREVILNAEQINTVFTNSLLALAGDETSGGATLGVQSANKYLQALSDIELVNGLCSELAECTAKLDTVVDTLREEVEKLDISPTELDTVENRLAVVQSVIKKYGGSEELALEYLRKCSERLENIQCSDEAKEKLQEQFEVQKEKAYTLALKLRKSRQATASKLEKDIITQLEFLNMPGAVFEVDFTDGPISSTGIDKVEFKISINRGEVTKPLVNVASGGELSRIMLAIKSVLGEHDQVGTLIFDEIDAGVSGMAAEKIGIKLREISEKCQVICITHLAQIACLADNHYLINKSVSSNRTFTEVTPLGETGRIRELARIMGGSNITQEILESAQQLLNLNAKSKEI